MNIIAKLPISKNLLGLYLAHGLNAVSPIIIFPMVLSIMGPDKYSTVIVGEAIMLVTHAISLYGFEINGIQKLLRDEEKYFNLIMSTRLILLSLIFLVLLLVQKIIAVDIVVLSFWLLYSLAYILQNNYLFLKKDDYFNLFLRVFPGRILALLMVFLIVKKESPAYYVPMIIGTSYFLSSLWVLRYILKKYNLKFSGISINEFKSCLRFNKNIFIGSFSVLLLKDLNVLIIDHFSSNSAVSIYSVAEKITRFFQASVRPLNQLYFKKGVIILDKFKKPGIKVFKKMRILVYPQIIFLSFLILIFATLMKSSLLSPYINIDLTRIIGLLKFMIPTTVLGILNYMFGNLGLNHLSHEKYYSKIIILTGLISIVLTSFLTSWKQETGTALGFFLSELILLFLILPAYLRIIR